MPTNESLTTQNEINDFFTTWRAFLDTLNESEEGSSDNPEALTVCEIVFEDEYTSANAGDPSQWWRGYENIPRNTLGSIEEIETLIADLPKLVPQPRILALR